MLNVVILIGRLTKDPELRYTPSGKPVARMRLAVDRGTSNSQTGEKDTDFIDIVTWDKQAETCANYLQKGRLVAVQGRLQIRNYDAQDGTKRQATEVVANTVRFLESKRAGEGGPAPAPTGGQGGGSQNPAAPSGSFGSDINFGDDDDVPF